MVGWVRERWRVYLTLTSCFEWCLLLYIFLNIAVHGSVVLFEPNRAVLYAEIAVSAAFIVLHLVKARAET